MPEQARHRRLQLAAIRSSPAALSIREPSDDCPEALKKGRQALGTAM